MLFGCLYRRIQCWQVSQVVHLWRCRSWRSSSLSEFFQWHDAEADKKTMGAVDLSHVSWVTYCSDTTGCMVRRMIQLVAVQKAKPFRSVEVPGDLKQRIPSAKSWDSAQHSQSWFEVRVLACSCCHYGSYRVSFTCWIMLIYVTYQIFTSKTPLIFKRRIPICFTTTWESQILPAWSNESQVANQYGPS